VSGHRISQQLKLLVKHMNEEYLDNLMKVVPKGKLMKMRSLKDLYPYLPFSVAGLEVKQIKSIHGETARNKMGAFINLSNTPATQMLSRAYDPRAIVKLAEKRIPRDYDPELVAWEGDFSKALKPRGGRNPFHMLEMALQGGPTGAPVKKGPTPYDWDIFYDAVDDVIARYKEEGVSDIRPKHLVPVTPASSKSCLRIAHVMNNSAGNPFFSDPKIAKSSKAHNLEAALEMTHRLLQPDNDSLPLWPALGFARGDRAADWEIYMDTETARDKAVLSKRDRKIDAQSFILQMIDGIFTQALMEATSVNDIPEIDMREPARLSNHFENGMALVQARGEDVFSIGRDESAWDMHFPPQLWYGCYLVYKALLVEEFDLFTVFTDKALLLNTEELDRLNSLTPGVRQPFEFRYMDGVTEMTGVYECAITQCTTEPLLRRMFAGVSGTPVQFGDLLVDGYGTVLDTPKDGKFLSGWSMASGNFCTFKVNSDGNWIKSRYIDRASKNDTILDQFEAELGYRPPPMSLLWFVCRGDDAGDVWEVLDRRKPEDWKISKLVADWLSFVGASANAEKQETTDVRGRWLFGFAQLFTSENFVRGVSSVVRVLERNIWNESDEVVVQDPESGADLRPYLVLMSTFGRINNLWGLWDKAVHPQAEALTGLIQDLDVEGRMLPPLNEEERRLAGLAAALRLLRRGNISAAQLSDTMTSFWTTDLADYAKKRYDSTPRLKDKTWSPIPRDPTGDARHQWRQG